MAYVPVRTIELPLSTYMDLEFHLMDTRAGIKPQEFIVSYLKRWLKLEAERQAIRANGHAIKGVQWKAVFLPDGTNLRTSHRGQVDFAKVVGHRIVHEEKFVSPSQFANRDGTGRNAWRCVWLRFPGEEQWELAAHCRARLHQQAHERTHGGLELPIPER